MCLTAFWDPPRPPLSLSRVSQVSSRSLILRFQMQRHLVGHFEVSLHMHKTGSTGTTCSRPESMVYYSFYTAESNEKKFAQDQPNTSDCGKCFLMKTIPLSPAVAIQGCCDSRLRCIHATPLGARCGLTRCTLPDAMARSGRTSVS